MSSTYGELGPRKQQQQIMNLNVIKSMHKYSNNKVASAQEQKGSKSNNASVSRIELQVKR